MKGGFVLENKLKDRIANFFKELSVDLLEERLVNYIIRELKNGRRLPSILNDPYIKNRLSEEEMTHLLEKPELIAALEEEINKTFKEQMDFFSRSKE